jgi:hypothetical protein
VRERAGLLAGAEVEFEIGADGVVRRAGGKCSRATRRPTPRSAR